MSSTDLIDRSIRESESFQRQFFKALDDFRDNLSNFIQPNSAIIWNGNPIPGDQAFISMYQKMPLTKHDITDYNVHALPKSNYQTLEMVLDTSGKVKFGTERGKNLFAFSAVFLLVKDSSISQNAVIKSVSYRLVHKPEECTVEI